MTPEEKAKLYGKIGKIFLIWVVIIVVMMLIFLAISYLPQDVTIKGWRVFIIIAGIIVGLLLSVGVYFEKIK